MMSKQFDIDTWIDEHDGDDYCHYCIYNDECPGGTRCYGGEPWFPPCADKDIRELLDEEMVIEDWREENMNRFDATTIENVIFNYPATIIKQSRI